MKVLATQSCPTLCDPWAAAYQAPLSMEFSRREYWSGLPFPPQGIFPTQGSNPHPLHGQANSLPLSHLGSQDTLETTIKEVKVDRKSTRLNSSHVF